jgi:hypothetical protein
MSGFFKLEALEPRLVLASIYPMYVGDTNPVFTLGDPNSPDGSPYGLANTFLLSTNPGHPRTLYLDFDGHHSVNNDWGHNITFQAYNTVGSPSTFTDQELLEIQIMFQNVAEDYAPFDVNVTTIEPPLDWLMRSGFGDNEFGLRVVVSQEPPGFCGCGGVALIDAFTSSTDTPVFAFNKGTTNGGMTISHEAGHGVGLFHDGLNANPYHPGTGTGETGWGPIMGAPFGKNVTQWNPGDYPGADNFENDLARIERTINKIDFKVDDVGDTIATATPLSTSETDVFDWSFITKPGLNGFTNDLDVWSFTTAAGMVTFNIEPFGEDPNLDIEAKLLDSDGSVIATSNPLSTVDASFNQVLDAGTYYIQIDGVGRADGRYSEYGSLGFYSIAGTIVGSPTIDGDFNDDGNWDILDLDALIQNIAVGPQDPGTYDLTGDAMVDLADRDAWLAEAGAMNLPSGMPYLLADSNLDGAVDGLDFTAWNANKFMTTGLWSRADFNADNFTDGLDFGIWNTNKFMTANSPDSGLGGYGDTLVELPDQNYPFMPFGEPAGHSHHEEGSGAAVVGRGFVVDDTRLGDGERPNAPVVDQVDVKQTAAETPIRQDRVAVSERFASSTRDRAREEQGQEDRFATLIESVFATEGQS